MHYWNRQNFEGLTSLADALRKESSDFDLLADYCLYREQGLRKQAFTALNQFLEASSGWTTATRRQHCQTILELHARTNEARQFISYPLQEQLISPVLEEWLVAQPENITALRWSGLNRADTETLRKVLQLQPDDLPVRQRLIWSMLDTVDYATHHLDEGQLILEISETRECLDYAMELIYTAPDAHDFDCVKQEAHMYQQMLEDWQSYSELPDQPSDKPGFPEWCNEKNRSYFWPKKFYYS